MRDYLETMHDWYEKGLIDQDFTTRAYSDTRDLVISNKIGAANMIFTLGAEFWRDSGGEEGMYWALCDFPVLNEGDEPLHGNLRDQSPPDTGISVSAACEHPEIAVALMNYYYTDEGMLLANYGIEGVTFDYNAEGKPVLRELITRNPDGLSMSNAQARYLVHSGAMVFLLGREEDTLYPGALEYKTRWFVEFPRQIPNSLSYTVEESNRMTSLMNDITTYVQEWACGLIMGQKSFDDYDAFAAAIKDMGIDSAIAIKQAAYDRYMAR